MKFVKLAYLLRQHEILSSLQEKTASEEPLVMEKIVSKENEILSSFYKAALANSCGGTGEEKVARSLAVGGAHLLAVNGGRLDDETKEDLEKLATTGVLNYRLRKAQALSAYPEQKLQKIAQENNQHTIYLLKKLAAGAQIVDPNRAKAFMKGFGSKPSSGDSGFGNLMGKMKGAFSGDSLSKTVTKGLEGFQAATSGKASSTAGKVSGK